MNPIGHRFRCTDCGSEAIVTKPGDGQLGCCKRRMEDLTQAELDTPDSGGEPGRTRRIDA